MTAHEDRLGYRYQAASRYYILGETMETIATHLMLSRSTVSRLIKEAREQGLVRITLTDHRGSESPAAVALGERFGVRVHLVAVPKGVSENVRLDKVANYAGSLLAEAVKDHQTIGVAWGRTVTRVVQRVPRRPLIGATAVQLNGSGGAGGLGMPYVLLAIGTAFEAELVLFPLPAFFGSTEAKRIMWDEPAVRHLLDLRRRADIVVFGVGSLDARTTETDGRSSLSEEDLERLRRDGVVGDVCTVLLREDGSFADIADNARATGPTPSDLRQVPRRVCVVADPSRASAVVGALRAGVATDLVLDEDTAVAVLARSEPADRASMPPLLTRVPAVEGSAQADARQRG